MKCACLLYTSEQVETLDVTLTDDLTGAEVHLLYGVFADRNVITRAAVIKNAGAAPFSIEKAASAALDFPTMDYDLIHLYGKWAQERWISREPLSHDIRTVSLSLIHISISVKTSRSGRQR